MENNNRKALGRGLEQLFNEGMVNMDQFEEQVIEETPTSNIAEINVTDLRSNPYQPRKNFDPIALSELASSIKEHGIFQPVIIKKSIKGYEIVAGERRVRAAKEAGLKTVPAIISELTDSQMMQIALLENLQRENLNAIEEAKAYETLIANLKVTQEQLAKKLGKSRSHITNMLGLLTLPSVAQQLVIKGDLSMGHARVLSKLSDKEKLLNLADRVIKEGITVRQLEALANAEERKVKIAKKLVVANPTYQNLETILVEKLDTKVSIKNKKMVISFANDKDLERILEILKIKE